MECTKTEILWKCRDDETRFVLAVSCQKLQITWKDTSVKHGVYNDVSYLINITGFHDIHFLRAGRIITSVLLSGPRWLLYSALKHKKKTHLKIIYCTQKDKIKYCNPAFVVNMNIFMVVLFLLIPVAAKSNLLTGLGQEVSVQISLPVYFYKADGANCCLSKEQLFSF